MKDFKTLIILFFTLLLLNCNHREEEMINPTVEGNQLICPNSFIELSTQTYDTYQWKKRRYNAVASENISGENKKTLKADSYNHPATYISVEVTKNGKKYTSPEIFVDGHTFLPIHTKTTGDFNINPNNGNVILKPNQPVTFTLGTPINKNVTWYKDGLVITGETKDYLVVTTKGTYTAKASTEICPNYFETTLPLIVE